MNWDQVQVTWKQFKEELFFQRFGVTEDTRKGLEPSSAKMSRHDQSDAQPTDFRPDDRARRSEFSLHISC